MASASPHEVPRVEPTLAACVIAGRPARLIGDKADESDPRDGAFTAQGSAMMAPHRAKRQTPNTQDGRPRRRDHRRGKVERLFAWLQNFRRVLVGHDYYAEHDLGGVHLGCMVMLLRWYL
jgi:hypothetical protein